MSKGSRQRTINHKRFGDNYDKIFKQQNYKRIDIVGQNGNDGEHYLIEKIARAIAGDKADYPMMGENAGKKRWELHLEQALRVRESLSEELSG